MARKRAASESVHNKKKEAESVEQKDDDEMEPEVDHVAALRALRDKVRVCVVVFGLWSLICSMGIGIDCELFFRRELSW